MIDKIYNPDNTLDILLDILADEPEPGVELPAGTTVEELAALNDQITAAIKINVGMISNILPTDYHPLAAHAVILIDYILGNTPVMCKCEISNVGEQYPDSIIICNPDIIWRS